MSKVSVFWFAYFASFQVWFSETLIFIVVSEKIQIAYFDKKGLFES